MPSLLDIVAQNWSIRAILLKWLFCLHQCPNCCSLDDSNTIVDLFNSSYASCVLKRAIHKSDSMVITRDMHPLQLQYDKCASLSHELSWLIMHKFHDIYQLVNEANRDASVYSPPLMLHGPGQAFLGAW